MIDNKSKVGQALECFDGINGFSCSQSVFSTYAEEFGLDKEMALKLSCGLGGGMGRTGQACGAVTGAIMVLGLKYGKYLREDNASKERTYALVQEFIKQFNERNNTINCNELLQIDDMRTTDKELLKKLTREQCPRYVRDAAEILETLLEE